MEETTDAAPRKGKVWRYVWTEKAGLIPWATFAKAEIKKSADGAREKSKQEKTDKAFMTEKGLIPLPFAATSLFELQENCSFFDACVRQIAKDVVGSGYDIKTREGHEEPDEEEAGASPVEAQAAGLAPAEEAAQDKRKLALEEFFADPNDEEDSLEDIMERMVIDWGVTGWFGMEVAREGADLEAAPEEGEAAAAAPAAKRVKGIWHVPAHTIRVHRDGNKYCQIRGTKYRWFKRFGWEYDVNAVSGDDTSPIDPNLPGNQQDARNHVDKVPPELLAHELIFYKNYYPLSSWYGVPNILPAVGSIRSLIGIRDYNLAFFENYGLPAAIVTVTGEWEEESVKQLTEFIEVEIKGAGNAHKTIVMNPPQGGEVKWQPMAAEANMKEGSFRAYLKNLRDEVLVCYKMPGYRIGITETGSLGGNTAEESTQIYAQSIIHPLQRVLDHLFSQKIIRDGFGVEDLVLELNTLDARNVDALVRRVTSLFSIGAATRAWVAEELGLPDIPDDDPTRDRYFMLSTYAEVGAASAADEAGKTAAAFQELKRAVDEAAETTKRERLMPGSTLLDEGE